MKVWQQTLRPGDLFIDVGANVGLYTILAAECGATVISVEPVASTVEQLRANLALNNFCAEVLNVALADRTGTVSLSGPDANRQAINFEDHGIVVDAMTLDAVIGQRHVRGVKIDVEGAERLVLTGGSAALRDQRIDLIQVEWNQQSERCIGETREPVAALLADASYELFRPDGADTDGYGADVFARPRTTP